MSSEKKIIVFSRSMTPPAPCSLWTTAWPPAPRSPAPPSGPGRTTSLLPASKPSLEAPTPVRDSFRRPAPWIQHPRWVVEVEYPFLWTTLGYLFPWSTSTFQKPLLIPTNPPPYLRATFCQGRLKPQRSARIFVP